MKFKTISIADSEKLIKATALIFAASSGREAVVEQLLAAGADPYLKTHDDFTALDLASTRKILKLLVKLIKSGD